MGVTETLLNVSMNKNVNEVLRQGTIEVISQLCKNDKLLQKIATNNKLYQLLVYGLRDLYDKNLSDQ